MPVYIFYGQDTFSLREELTRLRAQLDTDGMLASSTVVLDGATVTPPEVLTACQTLPFFGGRRLVVVEGLLSRFNRSGRAPYRGQPGPALEPWRPLAEIATTMPPSTVLVLVDEALDPRNPLLRLLSPGATVRQFRPLRPGEVPTWLRQRAQALGLSITAGAVRLLAELAGNNLWALDSELKKLAAYSNGRPIQEEDVRAVAAAWQEAGIFTLVDAVVEGRVATALHHLRGLMATGATPTYILAMLARQYRLLVLAKEAGAAASRPEALAGQLGLSSPFLAERVSKQASRYTWRQLARAYQRLLEADVAIKQGVYSEETALEIMVGELANL